MKTVNLKKMVVVASIAIGSLFMLSSCHKDDDVNNNNGTTYTISGNGNGTQMLPSVAGTGSSTITGTYNTNTRMLTYNTAWTNLTGAPTSAGFYSGASGVAGTAAGSSWTLGSGLTGTGTFSGSMTLTADQQDQLLNNGWYYTYGTTANPNGEVRGQISATAQ
jgi:hypothetical protein